MDSPEQKKEEGAGIEELRQRIFELEAEILRLKLSPKEKETAGALEDQEPRSRLLIENTDDLIFSRDGVSRDMSSRKRAEEALRESEERYRDLVENSQDVICTHDLEGKLLSVSGALVRFLGYSRETLLKMNLVDILAPEIRDRFGAYLAEVRSQGRSSGIMRIQTAGGETRYWEYNNTLRTEGVASPIVRGMARDITERKEAERALRQSEERYRAIFEQAVEGFFQSTPEGKWIRVNQALAEMCGYDSPEEMMTTVTDIGSQHYTNREEREVFNRLLREQGVVENFEHETRRKDGSIFWASVSARAVRDGEGRILYYEGTHEDIDKRKKAERRLVDAEEQYRSLFETSTNAILIRNREGLITMVNPAGINLLGTARAEDLIGRAYLDLVHPEDRPLSVERINKIFQGALSGPPNGHHVQTAVSPREHRMITLEGDTIYVESTGVAFHHKGEVYIQGIFKDISERKRAERALRESEEKYRRLFEEAKRAEELYRSLLNSSADAIVIYDLEGRVRFVNPSFTRTFGWTLNDLVGRRIPFVPDAEVEISLSEIRRVLSGGPASVFETQRTTKDGRTLDIKLSGSRYDDHEGAPAGLLVILHDITQPKALEAQFRQAQKMEAIGTLAGGIAHDFNNLLQVIGGYAQLLLWGKSAMDPGHHELLEIQKAVTRAAQFIRQLLTFSRKMEGQRRPIDLNREILEAEKVLKRTIPKMVAIDLHLERRPEAVNADPVQIEQMLLNLASNAADAMPNGGRLILETRNASLDEAFCRLHRGAAPGNYVLLTVADTGQGMDRETVQHIFEPFFTTKEIGKGTGLGLASVYGIVKSHGGYILCESELGQGTVFKIFLPVIRDKEARVEGGDGEIPLRGGSETLLVVDDDSSVRELAVQILRRHGYQVVAVDCGEAALENFQTRPGGFDLVILDLGMPGMGGLNCLRELLSIDTSVRVLIASGYSANDAVQEGLRSGAAGYIGKPYRFQDLLEKVRTVLDEAK